MTDNICNILAQRNRFLSLQPPLPRLTPLSPYPQFTQEQLNMRRKVEILQYKKNSTQTNQLTKQQKWSNLVNVALKTKNCVSNQYFPTLSTACDVPGKPIFLQYDPNVPLYNYAVSQDAYSQYVPTITDQWSVVFSDLPFAFNDTETLLFSLLIQNVNNQTNTFSVQIPLSIYIQGTYTSGTQTGTIEIQNITLIVYYIGDTNTQPYLTKSITSNLPSLTINIPNTGNFNLTQYIGNFAFHNIVLPTKYGFVFDFKLNFKINITQNLQINQYGIIMNIPDNSNTNLNCSITQQTPPSPIYIPFSFTGN
jgi:hypothetical protein